MTYDVIVVGGGHAGCEAAHAAAQMGSKVLLITMNLQNIAQMSCNPAMGGVAKGQIVREIDALGGLSGIISDRSAIQFRMLNKSKGPAMWSPRTQNDRMRFSEYWRLSLEQTPNLDLRQDMVSELLIRDKTVVGVKTTLGQTIGAKTVVLTNGTFLNGTIHLGRRQMGGGRMGESKATGLTEQLVSLGFEAGRMKTGTPPRIDGRTIHYDRMEEQPGDAEPERFSYGSETVPLKKQRSCHITYTNPAVHEALKEGFADSPMFNGTIQAIGPRYCPSVEDKVNRFADRDRHQIFVEPEGWETVEVYLNGFSTSLPETVQLKAMRLIPGLEEAKMFRPGYAIEYDYFPPTQLSINLETKLIRGLFFAGQINGTTGYEEAACQGLLAGMNAHLSVHEDAPFVLRRDETYMGVLVDDLVHKGTDEPYRMFTSRAEFRILLRQDNADIRLTEKSARLGLATAEASSRVRDLGNSVERGLEALHKCRVTPDQANGILERCASAQIVEKTTVAQLLKRPNVHLNDLEVINLVSEATSAMCARTREQVEITIKYANYISKEREQAEKMTSLEAKKIWPDLNYDQIPALSLEAREKLTSLRPATLGSASRISGVNPTDLSILMVYMSK